MKTVTSIEEDKKGSGGYGSLLATCLAFSALMLLGVAFPLFSWVVFFGAVIYMLLVGDDEKRFVFLLYLFPFASVFKYKMGAISFHTILMVLFLAYMAVKTRKIEKKFCLLYMFFVIMCLPGVVHGYGYVIKQLCIPLYLYFLFQPYVIKNRYVFAKFYILSVLIVSVLGYFKDIIPNLNNYINDKAFWIDSGVFATRFSGFWGDPNYYSVNILLALSLVVILHYGNKMRTGLCYLSYVLLTLFGSLTASKSFLLVLVALCVFAVVTFTMDHRYSAAFFLLAIFSCVLVLVLSGVISLFSTVINRFLSGNSMSELTTGRSDIWIQYLTYINDHPYVWFVGDGFGSVLLNEKAPHNTYIDLIYHFGLIGSFVWLKTVFFSMRYWSRSKTVGNYLPLLVIAVAYFGLSELKYYDMMFHLSLLLMFMFQEYKQNDIDGSGKERSIYR